MEYFRASNLNTSRSLQPSSLPHVCLYVCSCVHGTAETLDGVEEWPDTQTSQQTDVNETYSTSTKSQTSDVVIPGWNRFRNQIFIIISEIDGFKSKILPERAVMTVFICTNRHDMSYFMVKVV